MIFENVLVENGLRFSRIKSNKFKVGLISFSISLPHKKEDAAPLALVHGLLRNGSVRYPSTASLNCALDELYGAFVSTKSVFLNHERIYFTLSADILDNRYIPDEIDVLGGVVSIMADLLLHPLFLCPDFDPAIFEREKQVAIDAVNSSKNNTRTYAACRCKEMLYVDENGNSIYPTLEESIEYLSGITLEDVRSYYKNTVLSYPPDIFYVGSSDTEHLKKQVVGALAQASFCQSKALPSPRILAIPPRDFCKKQETMAVSQGKLMLGFTTPVVLSKDSDDYYAMLLLNEIFGGSVSSKLFVNVREKMSLCYYCSSSYNGLSGIISVGAGIESERHDVARDAILDQLQSIRRGDVSQYEFDCAKRSIINTYQQFLDSPHDMRAFYQDRLIFDIDDTLEECRKKIEATELERVIDMASQLCLCVEFFLAAEGEDEQSFTAQEREDEAE